MPSKSLKVFLENGYFDLKQFLTMPRAVSSLKLPNPGSQRIIKSQSDFT